MISIIICSKSPQLFKKVSDSIESTIGIEYEIIPIFNSDGQLGICEAYNSGAERAKYPYLCFCHEDIIFHTLNWGQFVVNHLQDQEVGLIGVVGCIVKPKAPSGAWIGGFPVNRLKMLQGVSNDEAYLKYDNPLDELKSEVVVVDGLWMCCRKGVWSQNNFDQNLLNGFHGYDVDFSLQIFKKYKNLVIYDVLLEHLSNGGDTKDWVEASLKVYNKWEAVYKSSNLPTSINFENNINNNQWISFLNTLNKLKYSRRIVLKYLVMSKLVRFDFVTSLKILLKPLFFGK